MHRLVVFVLLGLVGLVAAFGLLGAIVMFYRGKIASSISAFRVFGLRIGSICQVDKVFVYISSFVETDFNIVPIRPIL